MGFLKSLIILLIIPTFGYGVGAWVLSSYNKDIASNGIALTASDLCTTEIVDQVPSLAPLCKEVKLILWMQNGSIISGVVAIVLLLSFVSAAIFAGKNRKRIALIFPPLVFISLLILSILVLAQGAILTYGAYLAESTAINRVHFVLIGLIGFGAFAGCIYLIRASYDLASERNLPIMGTPLAPETHPEIFSFVRALAEKLGARTPDHIVVGLEPNFYVTSSNVQILGEGKKLSGETLFLSLPLSRILSKEELSAVIGHELGHFRGQDTYYSQRFSPVYAGLTSAISSMDVDEEKGGAATIARLPALVMLSFMMDVFHKNISTISRDREFEADRAATEVAPAQALGTSLLKISLYANLWNDLQKSIIQRMQKRKFTRNMSQLFSSRIQFDINKEALPEIVQKMSQETISHPTDSHPPTATRLKALSIELNQVDQNLLILPDAGSIDLISNYLELEEKLTVLQQKYYTSLGVQIPEEDDSSYGAFLLSALGAYMVLADGKIEQEEIDHAEEAGRALVEDFDAMDFREYCYYPETLPEFKELLSICDDMPKNNKDIILNYLKEIAGADENMSSEEKTILDEVEFRFSENFINTKQQEVSNQKKKLRIDEAVNNSSNNFNADMEDIVPEVKIKRPTAKLCPRCDAENAYDAEICVECESILTDR